MLWDLQNKSIDKLCSAWRAGLRRVWNIPFRTHNVLIPVLSTCLPLMDEFCRRFVRFMNCGVNNDCKLVRDTSMNSILFSKMKSGLGRNAVFVVLGMVFLGQMYFGYHPRMLGIE